MDDLSWLLIAACFLSGLMWLRRAYVGEKEAALITLSSPAHKVSKRERVIALLLGIGNLIIGAFGLWRVIRRH